MLAYFYSDPKALLRIRSAPSERYLDGFAATLKQAGFLYRLGLSGHGFATQAAFRMA